VKCERIRLRGLLFASAATMWAAMVLPQARAVPTSSASGGGVKPALELRAEQLEKQGKWAEACKAYDEVLRADRSQAKYRARFQYCFRRFLQVQRHGDESYRKDALTLSYSQAIHLYELILKNLQEQHVDRAKAAPGLLFREGLDELVNALDSPVFRSRFLAGVPDKSIRQLQADLQRVWSNRVVRTNADAVEQIRDVAMAAQKALDLDATAVVLEFACGACNALDEFTFYLTPAQYRSLFVSARGKHVGVGIDLESRDNKIIVSRVLRGSPAYFAGIKIEDHVTRIGTKATAEMTPEGAMDLLRGPVGTTVRIGVTSDGMFVRDIPLKRQKLAPRSVEYGMLWETISMSMEKQKTDIGYIQIQYFQDSTPLELDAAIQGLRDSGMKALVLDLRGNPGGSFMPAVECARRFLVNGIIVTTLDKDGKQQTYSARAADGMLAPVTVPLVVLIDENTASSAEVLAGALKGRALELVGQTTFGKGCSQKLLTLKKNGGKGIVGAVRVTVARFFSPNNEPYGSVGVKPTRTVPRHLESSPMVDNQLEVAKDIAKERAGPMEMAMKD
jgi:carboxyl-terminal processing protease